jgi:branched-chain amino acid transport system substrate-binding protein
MSKRKWTAVALVALIVMVGAALVLGGCGGSSSSSSSPSSSASAAAGGTMKVGFVNSATGVSAAPNQSIVGVTQGLVDQINGTGGIDGKWQIELLSKDDGSDVAKASAAVTQLIQQDKVDFILQPWVDFIAPVARGIEEKAGMPGVLSYAPQKGKETEAFKWTFSNAQGAKDNADALVKIFSTKGWKTVVGAADVLTIQQETLDYVAEMAPGAGITFTKLSDQWALDQTDFSGVAAKVVAACDKANADALALMVTAPQADAFMKALKGAGLKIPVIGGPPLASAIPLFAQGTKNVEGMYLISTAVTAGPQLPDSYPGKPMIAGMYEASMAETNAPPDTFAGWAGDAVSLMAAAVTKAGSTDKAAVRDAFESITDFQGFSGVYSYSATDHVGIHGQMWLFQIKNGKYVLQGDAPVN